MAARLTIAPPGEPRLAAWWLAILVVGAIAVVLVSRRDSRAGRRWSPIVLLLFEALTMYWIFTMLDHGVWRVRHVVGLVIAIPAAVLWATARYQLGSSFTARAEARELVTHGLYSRIRNPIYVFAEVSTFGLVVFAGWWWLLPVLVISMPLQVRRARNEARVLEAAFGDRYRDYRSKTWF